jgi:hypothetical protein
MYDAERAQEELEWDDDRAVPNPAAYSFDDVERHLRHMWERDASLLLYPPRPADSQVGPVVPVDRRAA